ncbi:MAG: hypothetical protein ACLTDX_18030 [[Clostridium] innocuum]
MKITHGRKAQAVFDTTPAAGIVERACRYVGHMGKLMIYSGIYPNKPVQMDAHWICKGSIQILGTANSNDRDFMRAACMISEGIMMLSHLLAVFSLLKRYPAHWHHPVRETHSETLSHSASSHKEEQHAGYNKRTGFRKRRNKAMVPLILPDWKPCRRYYRQRKAKRACHPSICTGS